MRSTPAATAAAATRAGAARRGGSGALVLAMACGVVGCKKGPPTIVPAIECPDPCCGGNVMVDCEQNPNVMCTEDADTCVARTYGCMDGVEYILPASPMAGCGNLFGEGGISESMDGSTGRSGSEAGSPEDDASEGDASVL